MRVDAGALKSAVAWVLAALGEGPDGAALAADCLVRADMRGISTHGCHLLKAIAERVKAGMLALPTVPCTVVDSGATALLDGRNGLGPVAARAAMDACVAKAAAFGVGCVLVRNTNNVGFLGYYTEYAADRGAIGMMATNAAPSMAPWGGADAFVGTNPISISVPTGEGVTFTVDMASSVVARGKIRRAARRHERIPPDWALDGDGSPTTDPVEALKGTLLPIGGPKGAALALTVDIIAGLLAGSSHGPAVRTFHELAGPTGVGVVCMAIDVGRFCAPGQFRDMVQSYVRSAKSVRRAAGFSEILMPGEIERRKEEESLALGVEIDAETVSAIDGLLETTGSPIRLSSPCNVVSRE